MSLRFHDEIIAGSVAETPSVTQISFNLTAPWTGNTQTISNAAITLNSVGYLDVAQSATSTQREAARDALLYITAQTDGSVTITADGDIPSITIPCVITLF